MTEASACHALLLEIPCPAFQVCLVSFSPPHASTKGLQSSRSTIFSTMVYACMQGGSFRAHVASLPLTTSTCTAATSCLHLLQVAGSDTKKNNNSIDQSPSGQHTLPACCVLASRPHRLWWTGSAALMSQACAWSAQLSAAGPPAPHAASLCACRDTQHRTAQTAHTAHLPAQTAQKQTGTAPLHKVRDHGCMHTYLSRGCSLL